MHSFKGHTERISGLDFHPLSTRGQAKAALNMVSGAADGSVHMWSFDRYAMFLNVGNKANLVVKNQLGH